MSAFTLKLGDRTFTAYGADAIEASEKINRSLGVEVEPGDFEEVKAAHAQYEASLPSEPKLDEPAEAAFVRATLETIRGVVSAGVRVTCTSRSKIERVLGTDGNLMHSTLVAEYIFTVTS